MSEESVSKLWSLVGDLSDQLTQNRAVTAALQNQIAEIKEQAVHANAGFPLRRFNTDLSQEEYQSAIEEFSTKLVLENRTVQHENKQLSILLREYEATLEGVMCKFRSLAHANATHELELHQHYSKALMEVAHQQGQQSLLESTQINTGLMKVGGLLRKALRTEMGESIEADGAQSTSEISSQGGYLPPPSYSNSISLAPSSSSAHASSSSSSSKKTYSQIGDSRLDWSLEREVELTRLEVENRRLREMMGLDVDLASMDTPQEKVGGGGESFDQSVSSKETTVSSEGGSTEGVDLEEDEAPLPPPKQVFGLMPGLRLGRKPDSEIE